LKLGANIHSVVSTSRWDIESTVYRGDINKGSRTVIVDYPKAPRVSTYSTPTIYKAVIREADGKEAEAIRGEDGILFLEGATI